MSTSPARQACLAQMHPFRILYYAAMTLPLIGSAMASRLIGEDDLDLYEMPSYEPSVSKALAFDSTAPVSPPPSIPSAKSKVAQVEHVRPSDDLDHYEMPHFDPGTPKISTFPSSDPDIVKNLRSALRDASRALDSNSHADIGKIVFH